MAMATAVSRCLVLGLILFLTASLQCVMGDSALPQEPTRTSQCGVYLAPSSIPNAGMGLFAGRHFSKDEVVLAGDVVVPGASEVYTLWEEYQWSSDTFDWMQFEDEEVSGYSFGIGSMANCFYALINVETTVTNYDVVGLHRGRDPGAGAFSPYHNRRTVAEMEIPAGMEIFLDYGYEYFVGSEDIYGPVPIQNHYKMGDKLLRKLSDLVATTASASNATSNSSDTCASTEGLSADPQSLLTELINFTAFLTDTWTSPVLSTLPQTVDLVSVLLENGTAMQHYNRSITSLDYLEEHGLCVDHLRPGNSTIHQAGRGAFARRFIAEGTIVSPVPLIHIPDRRIYNVRLEDEDTDEVVFFPQLLLNYCFGHSNSTLLLCPYGVGTGLINHSPDAANVKIEWSDPVMRHPEWINQPVWEWGGTKHAGLAFQYVATRNIEEGEEVLLDYGPEWQAAWEHHVENWQPPEGASDYWSASQLLRNRSIVLKTESEGAMEGVDIYIKGDHRIARNLGGLVDYHWCRVVDRTRNDESGQVLYTVEILESVEEEVADDDCEGCSVVATLNNVPRDAFAFDDQPGSQDHVQMWSFRHEMMIPNELMPPAWLNMP